MWCKRVIYLLLLILIWGAYIIITPKIENRNIVRRRINASVEKNVRFIKSINTVTTENNQVEIKGWFLNFEAYKEKILGANVVLKQLNQSNEYTDVISLDTNLDSADAVNQYYGNNHRYYSKEFIATISEKKIDLHNNYEIQLEVSFENDKTRTIATGYYVKDGQLTKNSPMQSLNPTTSNAQLNEIIQNGVRIDYLSQRGLYLYQYENSIYYISESNFMFSDDKKIFIPVHVYTTDTNRLSKNASCIYDGFYFVDNECDFGECEYRVAKHELPNDYPIAFINTGCVNVETQVWLWNYEFQPNIVLN